MNAYKLLDITASAREHLDDNYYSNEEGENYNYTDTTHECIKMAAENAVIKTRDYLLQILEEDSQLNKKTIKMIENKFNDKFEI